jgi:hypothetical protein
MLSGQYLTDLQVLYIHTFPAVMNTILGGRRSINRHLPPRVTLISESYVGEAPSTTRIIAYADCDSKELPRDCCLDRVRIDAARGL